MIFPICKFCKTHKILVFDEEAGIYENQYITCYRCEKKYDIKNKCYAILNYMELKNEYHKDKNIFNSYYDAVIHRKKLNKLKKLKTSSI
jgi:uncharacterized protein YbaR (Trm112 family)